jgi:sugar lactone lactonase YvrE
LPTPNVTSCVFGGENLDILFITTAKKGLDTAASLSNEAGSVFFAPTQVQGLPAFRFNLDTDTC